MVVRLGFYVSVADEKLFTQMILFPMDFDWMYLKI